MPALSFLQLRTRVALNCGNMQATHPYYASIGGYVNDGLNKVLLHAVNSTARNFELFPELSTKWTNLTVADQAYLSLPGDALAVQMVYSFDSPSAPNLSSDDRLPVSYVGQDDYELLPKATQLNGYPRLFTQQGNRLYLSPTPRTGYLTYILVSGIQQEPELSNDADVPVMDKRWHSAIADYASYLLATDLGWPDDAARFMASCDQKIASCISIMGLRGKRVVLVMRAEGV